MTTGGDVSGAGAGAILFAAIGYAYTRFLERHAAWARKRYARIYSRAVYGVLALGGAVAVAVGFVMAVTGTEFH